ncbi:hypothetical protein V8G54_026884 [Vigna mungo]|uniref:Uncharacterized protein n=1 Tax=Vigna mungo TaxID=3915 RepID=A0AAQ3N1M0_VIGMU
MGSSRCFIVNMTFLLTLFIITSDLCMMKTEARGPIYRLPCDNNQQCQAGCRNPNCGCAAVCIEHVCQCPHLTSTHTDIIKSPHLAPPPHHHQAPPPHHHNPPHHHPHHHHASPPHHHQPPHQAPPPHHHPNHHHASPPHHHKHHHQAPPPHHPSSN